MDAQELMERVEKPDAVLALFDAADREQGRMAVQPVFAAQFSVERATFMGAAAGGGAVAAPGRAAAEVRPDPLAPQFADDHELVCRHDRAPLPSTEARIL